MRTRVGPLPGDEPAPAGSAGAGTVSGAGVGRSPGAGAGTVTGAGAGAGPTAGAQPRLVASGRPGPPPTRRPPPRRPGKRPSRTLIVALVTLGVAIVAVVFVLATQFGTPPGAALRIVFAPGASAQQRDAVLAACPGAGSARADPTGPVAPGQTPTLSYDITHAGDKEQAAIVRCVSGLPGVAGVDVNRGDQP